MLITLKEYAEKNNLSYDGVRAAISRGVFTPDKRVGQRWYVEDTRPWPCKRMKHFNGTAMSDTRLYNIWRGMKQRCFNKKNHSYYAYGGRGIVVCDEWKNDAAAFIEWSLSHGYKDGLEIDRIDNDKGYCPENCQWITKKENIAKAGKRYSRDINKVLRWRQYYKWCMKEYGECPIEYPKFDWE